MSLDLEVDAAEPPSQNLPRVLRGSPCTWEVVMSVRRIERCRNCEKVHYLDSLERTESQLSQIKSSSFPLRYRVNASRSCAGDTRQNPSIWRCFESKLLTTRELERVIPRRTTVSVQLVVQGSVGPCRRASADRPPTGSPPHAPHYTMMFFCCVSPPPTTTTTITNS